MLPDSLDSDFFVAVETEKNLFYLLSNNSLLSTIYLIEKQAENIFLEYLVTKYLKI
jgi:hypothetical protein